MTPFCLIGGLDYEAICNYGRSYQYTENGCTNGCASGTTIYASNEFSDKPGVHNDQEGFYVLEGEGYAKLDDLVFPIKAGDSFVALAGVAHTIRTKEGCQPVKVFWFHSAK